MKPVFIVEYSFDEGKTWEPRGNGNEIFAYARRADAECELARIRTQFASTDYRIAAYRRRKDAK